MLIGMEQLRLSIVPQLLYQGENFSVHTGVASIVNELKAEARNVQARASFSTRYIYGAPRSGKTHLAVFLTSVLNDVCLLEADQIKDSAALAWALQHKFIVIDDIDKYFADNKSEGSVASSGAFVRLYEGVKGAHANLIMFSSKNISEINADEHTISRLQASAGLNIEPPSDAELPEIIKLMAVQRGFRLPERGLQFLSKRLRRDIYSLERYILRLDRLSQVFGSSIKFSLIKEAAS